MIRRACPNDAEAISAVIVSALRAMNSNDYTPETVARVSQNFGPLEIERLMGERVMFVALCGDDLVGTASLDGRAIRTMFVRPDCQGRGFGRMLMANVEEAARLAGTRVVRVPSTVGAQAFYARLGYRFVREAYHGDERTIIMERALDAA